MNDGSDGKGPGARRPYQRPTLRVVELDVMASFPDNCKMESSGSSGFGGAAGSCQNASQPTVMCLSIGS